MTQLKSTRHFIPPFPRSLAGERSDLPMSMRMRNYDPVAVSDDGLFLVCQASSQRVNLTKHYQLLLRARTPAGKETLYIMSQLRGPGLSGDEPGYDIETAVEGGERCGKVFDRLRHKQDAGHRPTIQAGFLAMLTLGEKALPPGVSAGSLRRMTTCFERHFEDWADFLSKEEIFPFVRGDIVQILAQSGYSGTSMAVCRVLESPRRPGKADATGEHIYVLRLGDFPDGHFGHHGQPLIVRTKRGWSVGPEMDISCNPDRRSQGGLTTRWYKGFGAALKKAIFLVHSEGMELSGHEIIQERMFIEKIIKKARGAGEPGDIFDMSRPALPGSSIRRDSI